MTEGSTVTTTKYMEGGYQYENNVLTFFPHAEGYVTKEGSSTYRHVFTYTDHLGNIRLKYCDLNQNGSIETNEILEENHYYPFGLKHEGYNGNTSTLANKYKYNGKEYQDELGLNMYDMDMRQYDPAIARWVIQDPIVHFNYSPYNAFDNNPVFWTDPSGANAISLGADDFSKRMDAKSDSDSPFGEIANGGDSGGGGKCTGCLPQHGHVWDEVVVSAPAKKDAGWTTETERYSWSGTNEDYANKYGNMSYDEWNTTYGTDFRNHVAQMDLDEQNRILLEKLTFFNNGFEAMAEVIGPAEAINSFVKRTLPKKFNYTPRSSGSIETPVHGNSLSSKRPTWGYKLYSEDGTFLKNGITSKAIPETRYTKSFMFDKHMPFQTQFPNRFEAWKWEFEQNQILRGPLNKNMH